MYKRSVRRKVGRCLGVGFIALLGVALPATAASAAAYSTVSVTPTATGCVVGAPNAADSSETVEWARAIAWEPGKEVVVGSVWLYSSDGRNWWNASTKQRYGATPVVLPEGRSVFLGYDIYWSENNGSTPFFSEYSWGSVPCNRPVGTTSGYPSSVSDWVLDMGGSRYLMVP